MSVLDVAPSRPSTFEDEERWRCCFEGDRGERCHFPGSVSHDTRGSRRWYCRFHFFGPTAEEGAQIVLESRDWQFGQPVERFQSEGVAQEEPGSGG